MPDNASHPIWAVRKVHILIDPDKWTIDDLNSLLKTVPESIGSFIVGGTYIHSGKYHFERVMESCLDTSLPVGNIITVSLSDALISPNANFVLAPILIGSHSTRFVTDHLLRVIPLLAEYDIPCIPYAYLMLAGGVATSTEYFTQTFPIPRGNSEILRTLSLVAKHLGLPGIYLEAGSGALQPVSSAEIAVVKENAGLRILVGGGISNRSTCDEFFAAGADGLIVGTAVERQKDLQWLEEA